MIEAHVDGGQLTVLGIRGAELLRAHAEVLLADGRTLSTLHADDGLAWLVETDRERTIVLRLSFRNAARATVNVEQLRPIVAARGYRGLPLNQLRIAQTGWQSWSRSHPAAPFEPNVHSAGPPIRGPWLPHRRADSQLEPWMTMIGAVAAASPLLLGFVSARRQLGTLEIVPTEEGGHAIVAATELDGVAVEADATIVSEPLLIAIGDRDELLALYATNVAEHMFARPVHDVLTGWCSWYQLYTAVSEADVERNLASLAAQRELLPLRLIQLDDGFQHAVGDWLELNDKFPSGMRPLVDRIRRQGFMPGLWLAPFLLSANSRTYMEHPDWVVRDQRGEPLNAIDNWGTPNYAVDTTHPAVLDWLAKVVRTVCKDWGFEYLKLDFLYAAAMRGRRVDRSVTAVQAYRRGMRVLRDVAGERFILGCGAPLLPSVGLVDGMRIGSDVAAFWGGGEGNADGPSLHNATRATLARLWMHGRWWANDPDCVVVRANDTELSLNEVQAWAAVVALSGGMLFVGDDVSRVEPERLELLSRLIPPSGRAAVAVPPMEGLLPERVHLRIERAWGTWAIVGIANWSDDARGVRFDPAEFGLAPGEFHLVDLWSGQYLGRSSGPLDLGELPPHGMRLLSVHRDARRPQTVGSTGHLLGDAMDLALERWDADTATLTLVPRGNGPAARAGQFIVYDPRGSLRRVPFSGASTGPITIHFG
jgi:alpha-galactosidase